MVRKIALSLLVAMSTGAAAQAQNRAVTGTVTDSNGQPVYGASIRVEGTNARAVSDSHGKFTINAPANATVTVSYIGYKKASVSVAGRNNISVTIKEDNNELGEVTVVAYGTKRKQDIVGAVATVKGPIISNAQTASVSNALEGAVAGVQVMNNTGQPGSDASIVVRGIGSLSASNAALIVVDGVPFKGNLSDINPADIASITVSKDAVSNSLYGSRAAGGVVLVTTKKGQRDKTQINFSGSWGVSSRAYKDYNMVTDPGEFYRLTWYGIRNTEWASGASLDEAAQYASESLLSALGGYNAFIVPEGEFLVTPDGQLNPNARRRYKDTFADAMFDDAFRQEYNVSASGGNDKTDYYVSLGFLDNDSYIVGSSYDRFTMRANVNSQIRPWVKVGANVGYSKTESNGVMEDVGMVSNPFAVARSWAPIFPVHAYDAAGNMKYDENGKPMYDAGTGQTDGTAKRPVATNQNVICNLNEDIRKTVYNNLTTRSYAEFRFLKDFTFTLNYSYDYTNAASTQFLTPTIGDGASFGGRGTKGSSNATTTNFNQILAYSKRFGTDHHLAAKAGHEYYSRETNYLSGQKTNFLDPTNPELNNGGQMQDISSYTTDHNIEGYFLMADYDYMSKYYLSAAFRRDGTSRFLDKWGNFWSVGAAWRLSSEDFMSNTRGWLNELKLRASYGTQGNENILPGYTYAFTPYMDQYEVSWDGSQLGYTAAFYGNPNLTWEKQKTFDIGVDFRFLNRIYGSVEYFVRNTDDMLFQRPLPFSTAGRPYNWENIGSMRNQGIEFEINVDIFNQPDFKWTVTALGSHYKNKVLTLPEENRKDGIVSSTFKLAEGRSRYEYFTYMYAGMDENGAPQWYTDVEQEDGTVTREVTSEYADATKYWLGKSALPALTGGLNTTFMYKGFDLTIATAYQLGGYAYDYSYLDGMSNTFYVGHNKDMWNTFNPETGMGNIPLWNANNSSNSWSQASDAHLISASYFSIRNITLGYTLPTALSKQLQIEKLRVFLTADNLALFSKRQGFDPRVSMSGSNKDFGGYSPLRVITAGVNLTF